MKFISKPDLLNGNKQFKFSLKSKIITSDNFNINDLKKNTFSLSLYHNLLAVIIIIFTLIILFYKYTNKDNRKNQISNFIKQVKNYSGENSFEKQ